MFMKCVISNRQVEIIKSNQFCRHFQVRLKTPLSSSDTRPEPSGQRGPPGAGCGRRAPATPTGRHPLHNAPPPHTHTAYAILPSRGFQIAPVTFVGDKGKRCPPSLSWGSSPRPGCRLRSGQLPERVRQEESSRSGSPNSHPSRAPAASPEPPLRSRRACQTARPRPREPRACAPLPVPRHSRLRRRSPL